TAAGALALKQTVQEQVQLTTPGYLTEDDFLAVLTQASGPAAITLLANGQTIPIDKSPVLGPFRSFGVVTNGDFQVATVGLDPIEGQTIPFGVLQFGRRTDILDRSINRVWILVLAGTLGATFLAALAGVLLSARAMRPISNLTSAAREIARTRDPSVTLEDPVADDEVAELTRTLNGMFHELSLARAEREKSLSRQREFIADASHELRTPLTSVLANLELLDEALGSSPSSEHEKESVESALRSSRRMRRLVTDLQILARADSGHDPVHEVCDLSRIAANAVDEVRPLASDHTIELDLHESTEVIGNPYDLHRVVVNLVDNAARHTPSGSTISVAVSHSGTGDMAVLEVSDNGPGIPAEVRPQIFDRFVRNSGPGDRSSSNGTGLGLAIVQAIAVEHDGTATVADSDEGGTVFMVKLPLATADPNETVTPPLGPT
ncbi:MAG: HAMP domain-containing sensor histidine kinase, partial [Solirubrobacterales bacterium]